MICTHFNRLRLDNRDLYIRKAMFGLSLAGLSVLVPAVLAREQIIEP